MSESIAEMENRWALLMAAEHAPGHRYAGKRVMETDPKYAAGVTALRVQIEQLKLTAAARPQISPDQLAQLAWLDRVATARDAAGKQLYYEMDARGSALRKTVSQARQRITDGTLLTSEDVKAIGQVAGSSGAASYPETPRTQGRRLLPPSSFDAAALSASQPTVTTLLPSAS